MPDQKHHIDVNTFLCISDTLFRMDMEEELKRVTIRIPHELHHEVSSCAKDHNRSINAEIISLLSFATKAFSDDNKNQDIDALLSCLPKQQRHDIVSALKTILNMCIKSNA